MTNGTDLSGIQSAVYGGAGIMIITGTTMRAMKMMEEGLYGRKPRRVTPKIRSTRRRTYGYNPKPIRIKPVRLTYKTRSRSLRSWKY